MSEDIKIKSITIPNEIIIVENSSKQGYVVPPDKPNILESAIRWADGYVYDYSITDWKECETKAVKWSGAEHQHQYTNGKFKLKLCKSADNSWNGGKLSFWNCWIIAPDNKEFLIGINQELLCNLLQNCTVINGEVQEDIYLGRQKNNTGVYTKSMPDFIHATKEKELKSKYKTTKTNKYIPGDIVGTPTVEYVYLGEVFQHYEIEVYSDYSYRWSRGNDYYEITIKENKTPSPKHVYCAKGSDGRLNIKWISPADIANKKRNYTVKGHIDINSEDIIQRFREETTFPVGYGYTFSKDTKPSIDDLVDAVTKTYQFGQVKFNIK